jgi:type IV pilus assembly protein PilA
MNSININKLNKGFSLIELLVVVAIIGILAAVGVVAYSGYTASAKVNTVKTQHADIAKYMGAEFQKCNIGHDNVFNNTTGEAGGEKSSVACVDFGTTTAIPKNVADALAMTFKNSYQGAWNAFADGTQVGEMKPCTIDKSGCHDLAYDSTNRMVTLTSLHDDPNTPGAKITITTTIQSE